MKRKKLWKTKLININPLAFFTPCGCHSWNLVLSNAAVSCKKARLFFAVLWRLYVIFCTLKMRKISGEVLTPAIWPFPCQSAKQSYDPPSPPSHPMISMGRASEMLSLEIIRKTYNFQNTDHVDNYNKLSSLFDMLQLTWTITNLLTA